MLENFETAEKQGRQTKKVGKISILSLFSNKFDLNFFDRKFISVPAFTLLQGNTEL